MFKKIITTSILLATAYGQSLFANESSGYLKNFFVNKQGVVLFKISNPVNQRPSCANNPDWDYKFDLSEPYSSAFLDMLRFAVTSSRVIKVGYGAAPSCGKGVPAIKIDYLYFTDLYRSENSRKGNYAVGK